MVLRSAPFFPELIEAGAAKRLMRNRGGEHHAHGHFLLVRLLFTSLDYRMILRFGRFAACEL